jgi:adenylate cyclase
MDDPQLEKLANALVLVGRAGRGVSDIGSSQTDLLPTPFTRFDKYLMPGVEIHANLIEGALTDVHVDRLPRHWILLEAMLLTVLMQFVTRRVPLPWSLIGALAAGMALAGFSLWLYSARQLWLPAAPALALGTLIFVGQLVVSILRERDQQLAIRNTFALYVPDRVVNELVAHPEKIVLGGENRELTVLFTDLAGFTTTSETMEPTALAELLNEYFTAMGDIVFRHNGTIDKFIGDAIMAFWGAPMDDSEHARHGLLAAADMLVALPALNAKLAARGLPSVAMRIGLHTGRAVVGNLGSPSRFSYTAMGDTVNLASRLEGANKYFGTRLLVSDSTVRAATGDDLPPLRPVGQVLVKGKNQPVLLHTISSRPELLSAERAAFEACEAGDWQRASAAFHALAEAAPEDTLTGMYVERLDEFLGSADSEPPDTIFVLDEK